MPAMRGQFARLSRRPFSSVINRFLLESSMKYFKCVVCGPCVSDVQASMDQLRDVLVGRQAVLALKGITPLEEALTRVSAPVAAIRESEVFNIEVAITDFSASFDELESEYERVQTEEDVAQQVTEIIEQMEAKP